MPWWRTRAANPRVRSGGGVEVRAAAAGVGEIGVFVVGGFVAGSRRSGRGDEVGVPVGVAGFGAVRGGFHAVRHVGPIAISNRY